MKRITASLLVLVLMFSASPATPAAAFTWPNGGYWSEFALGDDQLDTCFADNTSPTFTNRALILAGMNIWGEAIDIAFHDATDPGGLCLSSEVRVAWVAMNGTNCNPYAQADAPGIAQTGTLELRYNSNCGESFFFWGSAPPVTSGLDVYDLAVHEAGHLLGLGHVDEVEVSSDPGYPQVWYHFENLCSGTYKWDAHCARPTGPKNTAGKIYSGSLDPGVGNFSSNPRPTLPANTYRINYEIANESLTRNPGGVRLEIYQGTTLKYTSPFTSGTGILSGSADVTFTTSADLRFRVQYSKAAIYDIRVFLNPEEHLQIMQPIPPHCGSQRIIWLSADDAEGIQTIYSSRSLGGTFPDDIECSS